MPLNFWLGGGRVAGMKYLFCVHRPPHDEPPSQRMMEPIAILHPPNVVASAFELHKNSLGSGIIFLMLILN